MPEHGFDVGFTGITSIEMLSLVVPVLVNNKLMAAFSPEVLPEVTPVIFGGNEPFTFQLYTVVGTVEVGLKAAASPEHTDCLETSNEMSGLSFIVTTDVVVKPGQGNEGAIV